MKDLNIPKIEIDELWVVAEKNLRQEQKIKIKELGYGCFAPESKLIIDFVLEPRKQYVLDKLIIIIDKHLSDSKTFFRYI